GEHRVKRTRPKSSAAVDRFVAARPGGDGASTAASPDECAAAAAPPSTAVVVASVTRTATAASLASAAAARPFTASKAAALAQTGGIEPDVCRHVRARRALGLNGVLWWSWALLFVQAFWCAHTGDAAAVRGVGHAGMLLSIFVMLPALCLWRWWPRPAEMGAALRADPQIRHIKILMNSSLNEDAVRSRFDQYDSFLRKPYNIDVALKVIASLLG
ncbi:hypothetical protein, partial [Methylibium sp.]|uniref:hypothetical protein n=1 Tax=Methylibium sp. TaxID=2067992 RepID=UPI00184BDF50